MSEYLKIVKNIQESNNPFGILSNCENLNFLLEKEKYKKNKRCKKDAK